MTERTLPRRALLRGALTALVAVPLAGLMTAADAAALDANDPQAKALGFVLDAGKVDPKANPGFKAGSLCSNCAQYKGVIGAASAPCTLFANKTVPAGGWCKVWVKKPA